MNVAVDTKATNTSIVAQVEANPVLVLLEPEKFEPFFESIKEKCKAHVPDLTTAKGRAAIKALAFTVTRTKTAIDDAGKKLNEAARAQINKVDASRRDIKARLDALADEVRKPLTEWEEKEDERLEFVRVELSTLRAAVNIPRNFTAADVGDAIAKLQAMKFDPAVFQDQADDAVFLRNAAVETLTETKARLEREEADKAELERLRAEAAERQRVENERARQQAEERRRIDTEDALAAQIIEYIKTVRMGFIGGQPQPYGILLYELERKIVLADYAERHREAIEAARAEAHTFLTETVERAEERRRAREAEDEKGRIAEAAKAAEERTRQEAERKHQDELNRIKAEQDRRDQEEAARAAEAKRIADEETRRANDQAHRTAVKAAAKLAIMSCGADEETAKKVVLAIIAGEIPAVSIKF